MTLPDKTIQRIAAEHAQHVCATGNVGAEKHNKNVLVWAIRHALRVAGKVKMPQENSNPKS